MQADIAFPISVMAAAEASEAKKLAERAEMQAFVNGYSHTSATPEERARYVEIVKAMYSQPSADREPMSPMAARTIGGFIVLAFLTVGVGAVYGRARLGSVEEGIYSAIGVLVGTFIAVLFAGIFLGGVALLLGYGT